MKLLSQTFLDNIQTQQDKEILELLEKEFKILFPTRTRVLGDKYLNEFCKHCQTRATKYKYAQFYDLKRYAIVAFYLGTYFDEDPLYPWVEKIFKRRKEFEFQVDDLIDEFNEHYNQVMGEGLEHYEKALKKLQNVSQDRILALKTYRGIVKDLKSIYPQRVELVGEKVLEKLFISKQEEMEEYGIYTKIGIYTYCSIVLFLGSHVKKDPLYVWVKKYLENPHTGRGTKAVALLKKGQSRITKELREIQKIKKES